MAFTGILITCGKAVSGVPALLSELLWSEHHTVAGTCTNSTPPQNPPYANCILEVYSSTDAFISYGVAPDADLGPKVIVKAGMTYDFIIAPGSSISWMPIA